jgi:phosphoribosylformylglycinamidine synthase
VEVRPRTEAGDPAGRAAVASIKSIDRTAVPTAIETANVYLIEGDLDESDVLRIAEELLAHPVTDRVVIGAAAPLATALIEVHPLPGVMDPEAEAVEAAIDSLVDTTVRVRTAVRYDMHGVGDEEGRVIASTCLANPLIHDVHVGASHPDALPHGHAHDMTVREVPLRNLDEASMEKLSRDAHLFLSLGEMQAVRDHFIGLGREPREIELETIAQTWSEHCVHKTLKATIDYEGELPGADEIPGAERLPDGRLRIHNLLKSTVAAATHRLMDEGLSDWCLSVFVDNAGIVGFDEENAVCFKVETHNHPSALEPYGGAATGIGGCIRDVIGTGLAARPIAATDVFCVAPLDTQEVPAGCLHPRRTLSRVVEGVRDYGNRMGIPTLDGTVWFDEGHIGNPLVYCGCVGVMPRDRVAGDPQPGDRIIAMGGRTGRDGIHGATFSSAELTDTHADEFSHAVQIGNPITEKKVLDAILAARDHEDGCLFSAITDCGAGGFSSAVGEMGEQLGGEVHLDRAPLKYAGLTPTEIWISEAQERMVLAVPEDRLEILAAICEAHEVEWCDLGTFGTEDRSLILKYDGDEIGRLSMEFMHEGLPGRVREAAWTPSITAATTPSSRSETDIAETLVALLSHPNIASKQDIVRQYDHEVQGRTIVKPFVGPGGDGPGDAAVITPVRGSTRGLAIGTGLATGWCDDPYLMVLAAVDECVRNLVCVGANPERIAILDNYCWPGCENPQRMAELVRASVGCLHAGLAYQTPFISGKDSLNNQFTTDSGETIHIPPTMLISGFGIVPDINRCVTMDAKQCGNVVLLVGETTGDIGGSHLLRVAPDAPGQIALPVTDINAGASRARAVATIIADGLVAAAHDCSEGGLLVAAAEMAGAGGLGLSLDAAAIAGEHDLVTACFAETPSRYLLEVRPDNVDAVAERLCEHPFCVIGTVTESPTLTLGELNLPVSELYSAWRHGLKL